MPLSWIREDTPGSGEGITCFFCWFFIDDVTDLFSDAFFFCVSVKRLLVINHYDSLLGLPKTISSMTYAELKKVKAIKGGYSPILFEEVLQLMEKNNV